MAHERKPRAWFAGIMGFTALLCALFAVSQVVNVNGSWDNPREAELLTQQERNDFVSKRLDSLQREVASLTRVASHLPAIHRQIADEGRIQQASAQLQEMELELENLQALQSQLVSTTAKSEMAPGDVAQLQSTAIEASLPEERIRALRQLRYIDGGRSEAVVKAALSLLKDQDAGIRADVLRQLRGVDSSVAFGSFVSSLQGDSSIEVRQEAASNLAYYGDLGKLSLFAARDHDKHQAVRDSAKEALALIAGRSK